MIGRKQPELNLNRIFDVLVIGGGNAALCAAMSARETGAIALIVESAPKALRGGNSRHTRNIRYLHTGANAYLTGSYPEDEFWDDLIQVTAGQTDERLAKLVIHQSRDVGEWMVQRGCVFQPAVKGTLHLARTNAFFLGGGKALMNAYYSSAAELGIDVLYDAEATSLDIRNGRFVSADILLDGVPKKIRAKAVVVASGGFQADAAWMASAWGDAARNFLIRGTPYNKGRMLRELLDHGALPVGEPDQCHAVAIDARAPKYDGGIVSRLDCVPYGIVVNKHGQRFADEGADYWPKRYAVWGRMIARQPDQTAHALIDAKSIDLFMPSVYPPVKADTIGSIADAIHIDPRALEATVSQLNRSVVQGSFNPEELDDCRTEGLEPVKSHWARRLDSPPYYAYPLRPGITFTYLGVKVNEKAQVLREGNRILQNVFAAGEMMSGNILGQGYMAGFGMTIGTVFGRIAGREAGRYVSI